ncbi:MAG TPA: MlaD family protein [Solirubrobacteraceae bacterium]|nr:MlaD family protein [Solirubrobacteraceae bacterium]
MTKQRPSTLAMATMLAFTASCVGLLIFLWLSFGGSLPLAAKGYRFAAEFNQATELAPDAAVTIAGVNVGKVVSVRLDRRTGLERAVLQIDPRYEPRPADTRAILREKTLLGETYVELSAGNPNGPMLRDGATLPRRQVQDTVQLDQILNAFDPRTRRAFETWMQQGGVALTGRGEAFNQAFASLYPFATNVERVLAVLRRQGAATRTLVSDGGQVFSALARSPREVQGFVRGSNALFAATAARDRALARTIRELPGFLRQARTTLGRVDTFAGTTKGLVDELRPAARRLSPALVSVQALAPRLRTLMHDVGPLTRASRTGLPAVRAFLTRSVPFLAALRPWLGNVIPVVDYIDVYRRELAGFFANSAASTQGSSSGLHYLRMASPINPELLMPWAARPRTNRSNPYLVPGGYAKLAAGLPVFGTYLCSGNPLPPLSPSLSTTTTSVAGTVLTLAELVQGYYITADPSGPACKGQTPLGRATTGQNRAFPTLNALR